MHRNSIPPSIGVPYLGVGMSRIPYGGFWPPFIIHSTSIDSSYLLSSIIWSNFLFFFYFNQIWSWWCFFGHLHWKFTRFKCLLGRLLLMLLQPLLAVFCFEWTSPFWNHSSMDWFCWENLSRGNHRFSHEIWGAVRFQFSLKPIHWIWAILCGDANGRFRASSTAPSCNWGPRSH